MDRPARADRLRRSGLRLQAGSRLCRDSQRLVQSGRFVDDPGGNCVLDARLQNAERINTNPKRQRGIRTPPRLRFGLVCLALVSATRWRHCPGIAPPPAPARRAAPGAANANRPLLDGPSVDGPVIVRQNPAEVAPYAGPPAGIDGPERLPPIETLPGVAPGIVARRPCPLRGQPARAASCRGRRLLRAAAEALTLQERLLSEALAQCRLVRQQRRSGRPGRHRDRHLSDGRRAGADPRVAAA